MVSGTLNVQTVGNARRYTLTGKVEGKTRCLYVPVSMEVIAPLFLDALTKRLNEILGMRTEDVGQKTEDVGQGTVGQSSVIRPLSSALRKKLLALQAEIATLTFLDPACGSGNFLTETYICLRAMDNLESILPQP